MRRLRLTGLIACLAWIGTISFALPEPPEISAQAAGDRRVDSSTNGARPGTVLLELFTSQGCSSCPPADRLLARLASEGAIGDVEVVPIAFHVDYWNYIGWRDPFSSREWSDRQRAYATAMDLDTIYTPQIFVDGRRSIVGSDLRELRQAVRSLARPARARLDLEVTPSTEPGVFTVEASAALLEGAGAERLVGLVALVQDALETPVSRGENARRTLENERVVRALHAILEIAGSRDAAARGSVDLAIDERWPPRDLGLVLFLQNPLTLEVEGVVSRPLVATGERSATAGP